MPDHPFRLRVVSPLGTAYQGNAVSATLPTLEGEITILAHHMPMVAVLADGEMIVNTGQKQVSIAIAGGFLETGLPDAPQAPGAAPGAEHGGLWEATVLSDFATEADSIEVARAEAAKERAEQLLQERKERAETLMVERDMQRAILQLKVAEKTRTRRRRT